jgi:hypothetical protein
MWRNMSIDPKGGLYREILTEVELDSDSLTPSA